MGKLTLKKVVQDRGFKVCELAKKVGVNVSHMSRIVNEWEVPPLERRKKICRILGVGRDQIWRDP